MDRWLSDQPWGDIGERPGRPGRGALGTPLPAWLPLCPSLSSFPRRFSCRFPVRMSPENTPHWGWGSTSPLRSPQISQQPCASWGSQTCPSEVQSSECLCCPPTFVNAGRDNIKRWGLGGSLVQEPSPLGFCFFEKRPHRAPERLPPCEVPVGKSWLRTRKEGPRPAVPAP